MADEIGLGTRIGSYRVAALIGQGGMGTVYRAEHVESGQQVALKVLGDALSTSEDFRRRFVREARYARELDHPNVVGVTEVGDDGGQMFMVMPEVRGMDLSVLLALEGPLDPHRAIVLLAQIGGALDALHGRGILHRDVKPANVIIASGEGPEPQGTAFLTDFGLGKDPTRDSAALTAIGEFVGTFEYVAPEQVLGQKPDHHVDLYSLGCVLYQCLTGQPPFHGKQEVELLDAHLEEPPPRVTASRPELPEAIDAVVAKAMAKDATERYGRAMELVEAARSALGVPEDALEAAGVVPTELRLFLTAGNGAGSEIVVTSALEIGRQAASEDGKLAGDPEISRRHARVWRSETGFKVEDLGSTNGTFVSGRRVDAPRALTTGDELELGATTLLVETVIGSKAQPATAPVPRRESFFVGIEFGVREARVSIGDEETVLRLVERDGRWTTEPS